MVKTSLIALLLTVTIGLSMGLISKKSTDTSTVGPGGSVITPVRDEVIGVTENNISVTRITPALGQVVLLNTEINSESIEIVLAALRARETLFKYVYLVITSPGGSVLAGNKLVSYIENGPLEVRTVCSQVCASMAFHIFEVGKIRYMEGHSLLMAHPASGGAQGTIPEMLSMLNAIKLMTDRLDANIAKRAKIAYKDFELDVLKNKWVETPEAIKQGLADHLVHLSYSKNDTSMFNTDNVLKKLNKDNNEIENPSFLRFLYEIR